MRAISQKRARSPDPGRSLGERREAYRRALVGGTIPFIRRIDHELAVVVADLVQRALPERGAGDGVLAERELHGLEELGVGQRRDHLLRGLGLRHRAVMGGFVLVPLAVSMKRRLMPATCTSWSPKLEISGVGL